MTTGEGEAFSFSTIGNFDEHIAREIRGYGILDTITAGLADTFMEDGTNVYDIGCSTGRLINQLAVELDNETVELRKERVTSESKFEKASLVLSLFTLQFIPVHERPGIIKNIYDGLTHNGAFIWAEKVFASDPQIESLLTAQHIDFKRQGSSADDILDKNTRLRSVMRPLPRRTNRRMLEDVGFTRYETFWRVNNFMATLAIKS